MTEGMTEEQKGKLTVGNLACLPTVTWDADVRQLFTQAEVDCMKLHTSNVLDLSDYNSVVNYGPRDILDRLSSTDMNVKMPPPNSGQPVWTAAMLNTFGCWIQLGCQEK